MPNPTFVIPCEIFTVLPLLESYPPCDPAFLN
jgi:hypothetical protein